MQKHKKGELSAGLITGLVMSIVSLVIAVTIGLIITSTLGDANLITDTATTSTVTNETLTLSGAGIATISISDVYFTSWNITTAINGTLGADVTNETLVEGTDYQIFSSNGSMGNITMFTGCRATYTWVSTDQAASNAIDNMTANLTEGIDNVSAKLPTVLLIAAIVLILTVLSLLVGVWQRMRLSSSSI